MKWKKGDLWTPQETQKTDGSSTSLTKHKKHNLTDILYFIPICTKLLVLHAALLKWKRFEKYRLFENIFKERERLQEEPLGVPIQLL